MQAATRSEGESARSGAPPAGGPARVLLVEDEPGIVDFVRRGLEAEGFAVQAALDGPEGERLALAGGFDVVMLDLMLPGRSGLEVLAAIRRARPALPVIVLTARGEVEDRVAGLDAGAVDYLVKPFSMAELLSREVRFEGEPVLLSTTEFELLVFMLRHHGEVLSREQILSAVWGYAHDPATNVVDVYIGYLRRKLARDDGTTPIFTVRSVGYRLGGAEE